MFKNKCEKKENHKPKTETPVVSPHGVGEIEAALQIINDALKTGQLPHGARGRDVLLCAVPSPIPSSPFDDRYIGYLHSFVTVLDAANIRSWDDIQAEQRKLKEEQLKRARETLDEAAASVERLARELGVTLEVRR
jgi:hypothetical protein